MVTYFADSIGFRVRGFLPSVGNVGWFTTACLKIAEQRFSTAVPAFVCVDYIETNPTTHLVVIDTTAR